MSNEQVVTCFASFGLAVFIVFTSDYIERNWQGITMGNYATVEESLIAKRRFGNIANVLIGLTILYGFITLFGGL